MSRKDEFKSVSQNPATKFIEWKSEEKAFMYYDKEEKKNVVVPMPFKFLTLMELHVVKGWHEASKSGIISNEVKYIGKEEMTVRTFGGIQIAKGLYKEIKDRLQGGRYHKSVYIMLPNGELANFSFRGAVVKEWGEFTKKTKSRLSDEWIVVNAYDTHKKGRVEYTTPVFKFNLSLTEKEGMMADTAYDTVAAYIEKYIESKAAIHAKVYEEEEDFLITDLEDVNI